MATEPHHFPAIDVENVTSGASDTYGIAGAGAPAPNDIPGEFDDTWISRKFREQGRRIGEHDRRISDHDTRLDSVEKRGDEMNALLLRVDSDVERLGGDMRALTEGVNAMAAIARTEASNAAVERRFNGQVYQQLNDRLEADKLLREAYYRNDALRSQAETARLKWGRLTFWAVCALVLAVMLHGAFARL